jgi:hypothetical protein
MISSSTLRRSDPRSDSTSSGGSIAARATGGGTPDTFSTHVHGPGCGCEVSRAEVARMEAATEARVAAAEEQGEEIQLVTGGVIDVYLHVINKGEGVENGDLAQEQVDAQIQVLNDAYKDTGWSFRVVETDRTTNESWYFATLGTEAQTEMKKALHKGGADDLNLYINDCKGPNGKLLGYATFPHWYQDDPLDDGVVIRNTSLPGGTIKLYNEGDTAVHEVGHWMGLFHTFKQGDRFHGDAVEDTPEHLVNEGIVEEGTDTLPDLPGLDPIHNFMNYTADSIMNEFTPGQNARMDEAWSVFRAQDDEKPEPVARDFRSWMHGWWGGAYAP